MKNKKKKTTIAGFVAAFLASTGIGFGGSYALWNRSVEQQGKILVQTETFTGSLNGVDSTVQQNSDGTATAYNSYGGPTAATELYNNGMYVTPLTVTVGSNAYLQWNTYTSIGPRPADGVFGSNNSDSTLWTVSSPRDCTTDNAQTFFDTPGFQGDMAYTSGSVYPNDPLGSPNPKTAYVCMAWKLKTGSYTNTVDVSGTAQDGSTQTAQDSWTTQTKPALDPSKETAYVVSSTLSDINTNDCRIRQ